MLVVETPLDSRTGSEFDDGSVPIAALLLGCSITRAAERANVDRTTVHRWLRDADFAAELHGRQNEFRDALQIRVMRLARKACRTIE